MTTEDITGSSISEPATAQPADPLSNDAGSSEPTPPCPWLFADDTPAEHDYGQEAPTQQYLEYLARLEAMGGLGPTVRAAGEPIDELAAMRKRTMRPAS